MYNFVRVCVQVNENISVAKTLLETNSKSTVILRQSGSSRISAIFTEAPFAITECHL